MKENEILMARHQAAITTANSLLETAEKIHEQLKSLDNDEDILADAVKACGIANLLLIDLNSFLQAKE